MGVTRPVTPVDGMISGYDYDFDYIYVYIHTYIYILHTTRWCFV